MQVHLLPHGSKSAHPAHGGSLRARGHSHGRRPRRCSAGEILQGVHGICGGQQRTSVHAKQPRMGLRLLDPRAEQTGTVTNLSPCGVQVAGNVFGRNRHSHAKPRCAAALTQFRKRSLDSATAQVLGIPIPPPGGRHLARATLQAPEKELREAGQKKGLLDRQHQNQAEKGLQQQK